MTFEFAAQFDLLVVVDWFIQFSRQTGTEFKSIQQANQMAANQTNKLPDFISVNSEFISIFSSSLSLWNYCYNNIQISFHFISETGFQKLKLMKLKSLILSFRLHYFPASQLLQQHFIHSRQFHFSIRFHYSFNLCFISFFDHSFIADSIYFHT